jgi:hypothetical protein
MTDAERIELLRTALENAPNPRIVDGPPRLWEWYDGERAEALRATERPVNVVAKR